MEAMDLIDIGVNLTQDRLRRDLSGVLKRASEAGVVAMVVTGTDGRSSETALKIAADYPGTLYSTAGYHPHHAKDFNADSTTLLRDLSREAPVVAIGETGLDFNRDFSPRPQQERAFAAQLELATELQLPVFLHQRDAHERFLGILKDYRDRLVNAVVHCFTGTRNELWAYLDMDLYVGVTGWICDERRGQALQECVKDIPDQRLLIETDAPFLLPRNIRPRPKGGTNEPAFLPYVLEAVAEHRNQVAATVAKNSSANARQLFRIAPSGATET